MKIKRRFPNFFTGFEETEHEVNSNEELMAIDWISSYKDIPNHLGVFCEKSKNDSPSYLLSLTWDNTEKEVIYFVVGYIFGNPDELGLQDYNDFITKYKHEN
jgi:hypothetical protein